MAEATNVGSLSHDDSALAAGISLAVTGSPARNELCDPATIPTVTFYPHDQSSALVIPSSAYMLDGFRQWALSSDYPASGRITYLQGRLIVDMSPESLEEHAFVKREVCRVLVNLVHDRKSGQFLLDGVLYTNESAGVSNEPDALFVRTETLRAGTAKLTAERTRPQSSKEITGTVDWTLEIVSPRSISKDTQYLREAYFRAGVGEYWLIDALGDEIDFQVLIPGDAGYVPVKPYDDWLASPMFGCQFRLTRQKDVDDYWQYTLDMREAN